MKPSSGNASAGATGAVIAAAGLSSRMGSFKPLLSIAGEPAVAHIIRTLRAGGTEQIFIVTGHRAEELESALLNGSLNDGALFFIRNLNYAETGMFESVCLGLERAVKTCKRIFVTPADVPLFCAETVRTLLALEGDVVIPAYRGRDGHPVLFTAQAVPEILSFCGEGGLHGAMLAMSGHGGTLRVEVPDDKIFMDMDTPEDYRRLVAEERRTEGVRA